MPDLPVVAQEHLPDQVEALFSTFETEQETYKVANGKYEQKLAATDNGITREVHEYVCPDGTVGWQAFVTAEIDSVMKIKSFGVGPESNSRDHDWVDVTEA